MATNQEIQEQVDKLVDAIDARILALAEVQGYERSILELAEARAWVTHPGQSHGGGVAVTTT